MRHVVLTRSLLAMAISVAAALVVFPALALGTRARSAALVALGTAAALAPLIIPPESRVPRFLVALYASTLLMKIRDLHVGALRGDRPRLGDFLAFLASPLFLVFRKRGLERQPASAGCLRDLALGALGGCVVSAALLLMLAMDWSRWPFLVEHSLKATAFFLFGLSCFQFIAAATRLLGGYVVRTGDRPLSARTPADFWRRYNRMVGQFLHEDVFKPLHGRRHPLRTTLVVFAVSGLIHEYIFWAAIGRVQGYQMLFFMLQGCAVVLTLSIDPAGGRAVVWRLGTLAFNLATSVLFFASCDEVLRIYQAGPPRWLAAFDLS